MVLSGVRLGAGTQLRITEEDAEAILSEIDAVEAASAYRDKTVQLVYGALNWATKVNGVTADYLAVRDWPIAAGRPIEGEDVRGAAKVALLGQTTLQNLFPYADPLGQIIRLANVPLTIVGVLGILHNFGLNLVGEPSGIAPNAIDETSILGLSLSLPYALIPTVLGLTSLGRAEAHAIFRRRLDVRQPP